MTQKQALDGRHPIFLSLLFLYFVVYFLFANLTLLMTWFFGWFLVYILQVYILGIEFATRRVSF